MICEGSVGCRPIRRLNYSPREHTANRCSTTVRKREKHDFHPRQFLRARHTRRRGSVSRPAARAPRASRAARGDSCRRNARCPGAAGAWRRDEPARALRRETPRRRCLLHAASGGRRGARGPGARRGRCVGVRARCWLPPRANRAGAQRGALLATLPQRLGGVARGTCDGVCSRRSANHSVYRNYRQRIYDMRQSC